MTAVCADNGEPLCIVTDDEDVATATHIALSDPGTTQQDIEEIIKLRAEVERLRGEVARLDKEADWLAQTAANSGWEGYRTGPERMRDRARKAVEDENV